MKLFFVIGSLLVAAALVLLVQSATPIPKKKKGSRPLTTPSVELQDLLSRAQSLSQSQEFMEAHKLLRQAREIDPRRPESYLIAGRVYQNAGLPQGAAEEWSKGLEQAGENPDLLLALASLALQTTKSPETALVFLKRVQAVAPETPQLSLTLAEATAALAEREMQSGDRVKASASVAEALKLDPGCILAYSISARLAEADNRWADATASWEKVFSAQPSVEHRRSLAEAHKRLGYLKLVPKRDEAIVHFRRTVDLAAEGVDLNTLLEVLRQEAASAFEEGKKRYESGDFPKAKEQFAYASSLIPENYLADNHLGLVLWKLEDREGAASAWESAIAKAAKVGAAMDTVPTHKNLAILYKEMGKVLDAQRVGKDYLTKYPSGIYLGEIRELIGD